MDLRYSDDDEAFRKEVRAWLDDAVPAHGPPPPPGDWHGAPRVRHRVAAASLHDAGYAGLDWPVEYGGRGLPIVAAARLPRGVRARAGAPYVGINFVGNAARRARR